MFLYDIAHDEEEKYDRSAEQPAIVKELKREKLDHWEKTQTIKPAWPSTSNVLINVDRGRFILSQAEFDCLKK